MMLVDIPPDGCRIDLVVPLDSWGLDWLIYISHMKDGGGYVSHIKLTDIWAD